jgi:hypothetical protein
MIAAIATFLNNQNSLCLPTNLPRTGHWTKIRRSLARFSGLEASIHAQSLAGFITTMVRQEKPDAFSG